jgi:hypothetical protein
LAGDILKGETQHRLILGATPEVPFFDLTGRLFGRGGGADT